MKDNLRLLGIRNEVEQHARKLAGMNMEDRHRYLQCLIGRPAPSASESDMRAMLMTRLRELKIWPPR